MASVSKIPVPEVEEPWLLTQERNGAWRAMISLGGELYPLGYFGSREDAEEMIALHLPASRPREAGAGPPES